MDRQGWVQLFACSYYLTGDRTSHAAERLISITHQLDLYLLVNLPDVVFDFLIQHFFGAQYQNDAS